MNNKSLGQIDHININIDKPLKLDLNIEFNQLTMMTGANGTGKSFINKLNFCAVSISNVYILTKNLDLTKKQAQFFFDNCFDNQDINGEINLKFTSEFEIKFKFDNGNIIDLDVNHVVCDNITNIIYMSSNMRLLTELEKYINIKDTICPKGLITDEDFLKMCKFYKLYDIIYAETLYISLEKGIDLAKLDGFTGFKPINKVYYSELSKKICYSLEDGTEGLVSHLSAGEQAIINMFITTSINS